MGWRVFETTHGSRGSGGGGGISCHQKSIKGDYRILTADEEGGGDHENIREPYGGIR